MLRIYNDTGGGGEKTNPKEEEYYGKARTSSDDTADVRDILSSLVGRGVSNLTDNSTRAEYQRLMALVGPQKANKLITQVFAHNSRSQSVPMEKRVQSFYDIGSNDAEVDEVLKKVKSFGYGVLPGFREQGKQSLQELTGRVSSSETAGVDNSQLQQKVMLRLNK